MNDATAPAVNKGAAASAAAGVPGWVPWVVLMGLLTMGFAGGLGLVKPPRLGAAPDHEPAATATNPHGVATVVPGPSATPSAVVQEKPPGAPDSMEVRRILVQYKGSWKAEKNVTRSASEAKRLADDALARLKKGEAWEKVLAEFAPDNPAAASKGGVLGVVHWDTAPTFVRMAMFKLKPGQISDEVHESPFGFHIYQRLK